VGWLLSVGVLLPCCVGDVVWLATRSRVMLCLALCRYEHAIVDRLRREGGITTFAREAARCCVEVAFAADVQGMSVGNVAEEIGGKMLDLLELPKPTSSCRAVLSDVFLWKPKALSQDASILVRLCGKCCREGGLVCVGWGSAGPGPVAFGFVTLCSGV
jgi:hypothetical protein